jgi:hypothetical protein
VAVAGVGRRPGETRGVELRHRIFVTLFLLSVFAFAVWFAFVYTWPMAVDPRID